MPPAIAWFAGVGVACGGRCRTDEPVLDGGALASGGARCGQAVGSRADRTCHTALTKPPIHGTFGYRRARLGVG